MKRAGHLFEQAVGFPQLVRAARRAARGKTRSESTSAFLFDLEVEVLRLERELRDGSWRPGGYRTFVITDPKRRLISAAPFRDRVVHHALCDVLEPVLERSAVFDSYACRKGKGTLAAIQRAQAHARRSPWFLKLDVRHMFETLNHERLVARLRRMVKDARFLDVLEGIVRAGAPGAPAGVGLPIGNLTSQHFANFFLGAADHFVLEGLRPEGYCRYMDDFLLFGPDRDRLRRWRDAADDYLGEQLDLTLKAEATRLDRVSSGVPFLGFRIWPRTVRLDAARARRFRRKVRAIDAQLHAGGMDDDEAARCAASLVGWTLHGDTRSFRRSFFAKRGEDGEGRQRAPTG